MGEITYLWEEEVNCPKVNPLTLIGITKGPRNKGKAVIEEEEEILRIEQAPREEVNMEAQKINEVPTVPLHTSAMEEVPSHELEASVQPGADLKKLGTSIHLGTLLLGIQGISLSKLKA